MTSSLTCNISDGPSCVRSHTLCGLGIPFRFFILLMLTSLSSFSIPFVGAHFSGSQSPFRSSPVPFCSVFRCYLSLEFAVFSQSVPSFHFSSLTGLFPWSSPLMECSRLVYLCYWLEHVHIFWIMTTAESLGDLSTCDNRS